MRIGMREILVNNLRRSGLRWLLSQAYKFAAIPFSMKFLNGQSITGPLLGSIFVTYRCNSSCTMCSYPKRAQKDELGTEEVAAVIDDMMKLRTSGIGFTGGEPLLRSDMPLLIKHARSYGIPVTLNTNGILLNNATILNRVVESDPTNINISLDGCCRETHDRLRGREGLFDKTVSGIRLLADNIGAAGSNTKITIVTVVSDANSEEIEAIAELANRTGAHRIGFMPLHNYDAASCSVARSDKLTGISRRLKAIKSIPLENSSRFVESFDLAVSGEPFPAVCNAGYTSLFVDPYGRIAPCLGYLQMGKWTDNIRMGTTLTELWKSDGYAHVRAEATHCRKCYLNCQAELSFLWPSYLIHAVSLK